jgi:hypothetical protein
VTLRLDLENRNEGYQQVTADIGIRIQSLHFGFNFQVWVCFFVRTDSGPVDLRLHPMVSMFCFKAQSGLKWFLAQPSFARSDRSPRLLSWASVQAPHLVLHQWQSPSSAYMLKENATFQQAGGLFCPNHHSLFVSHLVRQPTSSIVHLLDLRWSFETCITCDSFLNSP